MGYTTQQDPCQARRSRHLPLRRRNDRSRGPADVLVFVPGSKQSGLGISTLCCGAMLNGSMAASHCPVAPCAARWGKLRDAFKASRYATYR
jgi:hypothetical protein